MHSIGIDAVDIARFNHWNKYHYSTLRKVFSHKEIEYCLSNPLKSAERFAVRFAAKEALFKALFKFFEQPPISLFKFFKHVEVINSPEPSYIIEWDTVKCKQTLSDASISLSLTHTKNVAYATTIIMFDKEKSLI